jgi:hypothetical protein
VGSHSVKQSYRIYDFHHGLLRKTSGLCVRVLSSRVAHNQLFDETRSLQPEASDSGRILQV